MMCVNPCKKEWAQCICLADAVYPEVCTGSNECAGRLTQLSEGARAHAARPPSEVVKRAGTSGALNMARLKVYLLNSAFDLHGSPSVHLACLQAHLALTLHHPDERPLNRLVLAIASRALWMQKGG